MGRFLSGALESLLAQTHPRVEIIVQDNCSADETRAVLERYRGRLDQVAVERDAGQTDALRRGFARSRGEILAWLNADDLLMPDAVARAVECFDSGARPDVVYGHCAFLDEAGQFLRYFHEIRPFSRAELVDVTDFIPQPSTFFLRRCYETVGGLDAALAYTMDWDLWCRLAGHGCRFERVDHVMSGARIHPGTKTRSGGWRRFREILLVNLRHRQGRLPVAAAGHLYGDLLRPFAGPLRPLFRRVGRRVWRQSTVCGLDPGGAIAAPSFWLRFPVYGAIAGAELRLTAGPTAPRATLNGHAARVRSGPGGTALEWRFEAPIYVDAAEIAVELGEAPSGARLDELRLDYTVEPLGSETGPH
jgi:GT2 family glycosyltransferase